MNAIVKIDPRTDSYLVQYEQAVRCLQLCKESLSLEGLTPIDITVEALCARAKLLQDDRAKQAAYELEIEKARTAAYIANEIVKRDKPTYNPGMYGQPVPLGARGVLMRAGWRRSSAIAALRIGRATGLEIEKLKRQKPRSLHRIAEQIPSGRGQNRGTANQFSGAYRRLSGSHAASGFTTIRSILKALPDIEELADQMSSDERISARRAFIEIRDFAANAVKVLK